MYRENKMPYGKTRSVTGIGDYTDYDAIREAKTKFYSNPGKYTRERERSYHTDYSSPRHRTSGRVEVVIEHWSGCTGERLVDRIKWDIEDYFPDTKFTDFYGREDSFEVFVNGKLIYSRIMQGGYPYEDEVLDSVWRAKHGKELFQVDRYSDPGACNIL